MLPFQRFFFTYAEPAGTSLRLGYRLEASEGADALDLEECFELPPELPVPDWHHPALRRAVRDLHFMAGVSYWKLSCPPEIVTEGTAPTEREARFFEEVWTQGLGELFYRNDLDPRGRVCFPRASSRSDRQPATASGPPVPLDPDRGLLLVGGGKDSAVAREVLRRGELSVDLVSVGDAPWIRRSAEAMGDRHLVIRRVLDPRLPQLNAEGAYNGHVPISAVIAFATRLAALAGGYGAVIAANERSASVGNVTWHGQEINHQWSKSLRFEELFQDHAEDGIPGGPSYFSLLRPLSELAIGRRFARYPRYFSAVTSCNANFRQPGTDPDEPQRWCGHCPKCLFVYLILAPHLDEGARQTLFGGDFLADEGNLPLLEELLGLSGHKPFECVGTPAETQAALYLLHQRSAASGTAAVPAGLAHFRRRVLPGLADPEALVARELAPAPDHRIPERYHRWLKQELESPEAGAP